VNEALDAVVRKGDPPGWSWTAELPRRSEVIPGRSDIQEPIQEQLIVELYSK